MARDRTRKRIRDGLLDELLESCDGPEDVLGKDGLIRQLTGRLVERVLDAELTDHLGYDKHSSAGNGSGNSRNGYRKKTLRDDTGQMEIEAPRDRAGTFEPQLIPKHTSRMPSFDEKVLSLYARGMSTREIQGHLHELYGVEVSPTLISNVTDSILDDVKAWQNRPLDPICPILYLDAIHLKLRRVARPPRFPVRRHPDSRIRPA